MSEYSETEESSVTVETRNAALMRQWFEEVWNQGRAEVIDEMVAADCITHGMRQDAGDLHGTEGFKSIYALFSGAFPDIHIAVEEVLVAGNIAAVRFSGGATHTGDHLGVAATHKPVTFTGMAFARWQDGKMVEAWNNVDMLGLFRQIGAVS